MYKKITQERNFLYQYILVWHTFGKQHFICIFFVMYIHIVQCSSCLRQQTQGFWIKYLNNLHKCCKSSKTKTKIVPEWYFIIFINFAKCKSKQQHWVIFLQIKFMFIIFVIVRYGMEVKCVCLIFNVVYFSCYIEWILSILWVGSVMVIEKTVRKLCIANWFLWSGNVVETLFGLALDVFVCFW